MSHIPLHRRKRHGVVTFADATKQLVSRVNFITCHSETRLHNVVLGTRRELIERMLTVTIAMVYPASNRIAPRPTTHPTTNCLPRASHELSLIKSTVNCSRITMTGRLVTRFVPRKAAPMETPASRNLYVIQRLLLLGCMTDIDLTFDDFPLALRALPKPDHPSSTDTHRTTATRRLHVSSMTSTATCRYYAAGRRVRGAFFDSRHP